ncbi:hypothetical protein WJX84_010880 [Apatococcus fuscideae]|uniref:Uncharacterized protein n=1 Tax=Apatococcus fuscideae TaxID=2026836 RepID=A0AAW1TAS2_9CHLO
MAPTLSHNIDLRNWNCLLNPGCLQWLRRLSSNNIDKLKSRPSLRPCGSSGDGKSLQRLPDLCSSHNSRLLGNLEALRIGFWMCSEVLRLLTLPTHALTSLHASTT